MVSLQSALLPEAAASAKRPPCLSLAGGVVASHTATSKKRKRDAAGGGDDDRENSRGEVVDGIELNFDAAPLPPEWQRCLDIKVHSLVCPPFIHSSWTVVPCRAYYVYYELVYMF